MSRQDNYFIVDGLFHTDLPSAFSQLTDENFGSESTSIHTSDGNKVVTLQSAPIPDTEDYRDYVHRRKILVQAWKADWSEESLLSVLIAEQLRVLYETQKPFWIQYDDEMARCWGRAIGFDRDLTDANNPHVLFTPHYPIFPFGHEPPEDASAATAWDGMVMVGKVPLPSGTFTVYPDSGMIFINAGGVQYSDRINVHVKYTWRGYVRIRELQLSPQTIAQKYYTGTVVFEQIAVPIAGVALAWSDPPYVGTYTYYPVPLNMLGALQGYGVVKGTVSVAAKVTGVRVDKIVEATASVRQVSVAAKTAAIINTAGYKYATPKGNVAITATVSAVAAASAVIGGRAVSAVGTGWVGSVFASNTAELISDGSESTYITGTGFSQTYKLASFTDPQVNTGHIVNVDWRRTTSVNTTLTVKLLQGLRVITTRTFTFTTNGIATSTFTLTGTEADSITDYTNLYIQFSADYNVAVYQLDMIIPTFNNPKYGSATGSIAVLATTKAKRTDLVGYPELAQMRIQSVVRVHKILTYDEIVGAEIGVIV